MFIKKQLLKKNNLFFNKNLQLKKNLNFIYQLLITYNIYTIPYYIYKHNYKKNSLINSYKTITHYQHKSFTHKKIYSSIIQLYKNNQKKKIHTLLNQNKTYHKTHYL